VDYYSLFFILKFYLIGLIDNQFKLSLIGQVLDLFFTDHQFEFYKLQGH